MIIIKRGKEVYRSIKLTDSVNTSRLSPLDELRLLFKKVSNDSVAELNAESKLTSSRLKQMASLSRLIDTAVERMEEKGETCVTLSVSSEYIPYVEEITDPVRGKGRFYDFEVTINNEIPLSVRHFFLMRIRKKR